MNRKNDWSQRLNKYLTAAIKRARAVPIGQLDWGRFDCCTFAFGAVRAMTGFDPMADFRGKYKTKKEAMLALREIGGGTLYKTTTKILGKPVPAALGRRGDVGWYDGCCGVVVGKEALFLTDGGMIRIPITHVKKVWKIG